MAKCPICNSRKGKRKCQLVEGLICSLCCGQTRKEEACLGCPLYKETIPKRKYGDIPSYSTKVMEASFELQDYANVIEGALCAYDNATGNQLKDNDAVRILELLLDKYHFKDSTFEFADDVTKAGFDEINKAIETDLDSISQEQIVKVLAIIRFVAKRRARGGRDYFSIIHRYVGERVRKGIRVLPKGLFENS